MLGDKFHWVAYNYDGGSTSQVTPNGTKYAYEDLPLDNIKTFELWDWRLNQCVLRVNFKQGDRLIWRRRFEMSVGGEVMETCHVVGKIAKTGEKGILGIFESDNSIEVVSDFLPNSAWFYPPQPVGNEEAIS